MKTITHQIKKLHKLQAKKHKENHTEAKEQSDCLK